MAQRLAFKDRLAYEIDSALRNQGFRRANPKRIRAMLAASKPKEGTEPIVHENEDIYTVRTQKGNFTAFVMKDEKRDSVSVLASNPREDAQGAGLPLEEQYFRTTYSEKSGSPAKIAEAVLARLMELAGLKQGYRMQVHIHSGTALDGSSQQDDGVSPIASSMRRAALNGVDGFVYTPHNSLDLIDFKMMERVLNELGMTAFLATEITMPLLPKHPSGPHHLVIAANMEAGVGLMSGILNRRDRSLKMPSYSLGMTMDEMYRELEPLRKSNDVIVGLAHPVNFNSLSLPIRGVGLFSAVEHGHISYDQAMEYASKTDFAELWNDSIYMGEMSFESAEIKGRMLGLLAKHAESLGIPQDARLSANLCNLLVATELAKKFGIGQSFGSDAHVEAALRRNYLVGGDWFSRGWTRLEIPAEMQGRQLGAEEIVRAISKKEIRMGAVLFTEMKDKIIRIVESRTKRHPELEREIRKQGREVTMRYAAMLAEDAARFAINGEFKEIKRMPE
jgi:predicted metal-dependent phosphoesterase TrpH